MFLEAQRRVQRRRVSAASEGTPAKRGRPLEHIVGPALFDGVEYCTEGFIDGPGVLEPCSYIGLEHHDVGARLVCPIVLAANCAREVVLGAHGVAVFLSLRVASFHVLSPAGR